VLAIAGIYLVASCVVRAAWGQWLKAAGPFSADVQKVKDDRKSLMKRLKAAQSEILDLRARLATTGEALAAAATVGEHTGLLEAVPEKLRGGGDDEDESGSS
jgi:hypothetical protein